MRKFTLPVSDPKKTLSGDLLKEAVHKALATDTLKPFDANDIVYTIPAGAETDNGTNGLTPKLNHTQEQDAALVAKLPSSFPIQEWDSMSTKAQRQAMMFSGLAEPEQWRLLNPSAPLSVLDAANRGRYRPVASTGTGNSTEILTNPSKTTYLQNGQSEGQLGGNSLGKQEEKRGSLSPFTGGIDTSRQAVLRNKLLSGGNVTGNQKGEKEELPILLKFSLMHPDWPIKRTSSDVDDPQPNKKNIEMFNLGTRSQRELKKGEYYYIENAINEGGLVEGVVILFDGTKYAKYSYTGLSAGLNFLGSDVCTVDQMWVKGYVNNIYSPKDYEGSFFNMGLGVGPVGFSASIGYNSDAKSIIIAGSEVMQEITAGLNLGYQLYQCVTDGWVYGEAPIIWGNTPWDRTFYYPPFEA
jgi:hypothetical protein